MSNNKRSNKEIQSEISRLQSQLAKRGQTQKKKKNMRGSAKTQLLPAQVAVVAQAKGVKVGTPTVTKIPDGCVVSNRELIGTIGPLAGGFEVLKRLRINPGSASTFRWLSTMANSWETYRFRRLKFEYITRVNTQANGGVYMSPDFDAQDGQPNAEELQAQYRGTREEVPWKNFSMSLMPKDLNRTYKAHFCMDDDRFSLTEQDEKTIDAAQVFISTESDAGAAKWGRVWVDYEVELFTPQPPKLPLSTGGARVQFPTGTFTASTGGQFTGNGIISEQDIANPLVVAVNNVSLNSTNAFQFLRDWSGFLTTEFSSTTPSALFTGGLNVPVLTGKGSITGGNHSNLLTMQSGLAGWLNNNGTAVNGLVTRLVKAYAGDIIGLGNGGLNALSGSPAGSAINYFLGGGIQ